MTNVTGLMLLAGWWEGHLACRNCLCASQSLPFGRAMGERT